MKIDKNNIEEKIFDYLEGNLTGNDLSEFKNFVNTYPEVKTELQYWKQSYISSNPTVNSSEFSSLKKSNKKYYWASGIAAAFLLGIGTMAILSNDKSTPQSVAEPSTKIVLPIENNKIDSKKTDVIDEDNIIIESISTSKEVKVTTSENNSIEEKEQFTEENIELSEHLDVSLEPSTTNRKAKLKEIKIKKESADKKKKEVDVIDIETGF